MRRLHRSWGGYPFSKGVGVHKVPVREHKVMSRAPGNRRTLTLSRTRLGAEGARPRSRPPYTQPGSKGRRRRRSVK
eukprot:747116-Hanusia_phi.AAC.4